MKSRRNPADGRPGHRGFAGAPSDAERAEPPSWRFLLGLTLGLQALSWLSLLVLFFAEPQVWYGFYDVSDIRVYLEYATAFRQGFQPYRSMLFEYPPLAAVLMALPSRLAGSVAYERFFVGEMIVVCAATAVATTAVARKLYERRGQIASTVAFAAAVLAAGPIVANRFDIAVGLDMAVFAYFVGSKRWWLAAAALGVGFALKLTPAMFLPLVLMLAGDRRQVALSLLAFAAFALAPFLLHVVRAGAGVLYVVTYHVGRPLQIESLLATPYLILHLLGLVDVAVGTSHGSQGILAPGTATLASLSLWLMPFGMAFLYALIWKRRSHLRRTPKDVPLVALGLVLAFVCTSKVLSPQFLIWTFPFVALVAAAESAQKSRLGWALVAVILLTQIGFPSQYWALVHLQTTPILLLAARNLALLMVTILAILAIRRLPVGLGGA